jgi:hypothetical protein
MLLSSCGITNRAPIPTLPINPATPTMTDCGPAQPPLPDDKTLQTWDDRQLFNAYGSSWQWGYRCQVQLQTLNDYYLNALKDRNLLPSTSTTTKK